MRSPRCQLMARSAVSISLNQPRLFGRSPLVAELLARAAAAADVLLGRVLRDDFVERGLLARQLSKYPPEALDVLARRARAGEDDRHRRVGDVDALVQNLRGDEREHL